VKKTRVYLTVDVECAEERHVRGRTVPALGYDLRVWGRFANQSRELGISMIMAALERWNARATFFVEPFSSSYFGDISFREVCDAIQMRGHDIQLHMHPVQQNPRYRSLGDIPEDDDIGAYPETAQQRLLRKGIGILVRAGVAQSTLKAFRAGNFGAANDTWRAMANEGLALSSNYNPCYFGKNCKMRYREASAGLFPSPVPGVWELPITCLEERTPGRNTTGYRHLQIAAVSSRELISALRQCRALAITEVTLVTHSFEFAFIDNPIARIGRLNAINFERFESLLRFLHDARDEFEVDTVGALASRLCDGAEARPLIRRTHPGSVTQLRLARLAEQAWKRADEQLSLARQYAHL
jgi:hypothetical protein